VIGFQDNAIAIPKVDLDVVWHVPEVGYYSHLCAIRAKREPDGVGSVVRYLKSMNIYIPNQEALPRLNCLHAPEAFIQGVWKRAPKRVHRGFRDVKWSFPKAKHLWKAVAVVSVLVGDEDAVDAIDAQFDGREASESFAFAEAAVHKESGALRLEQGDVARAARRQNGNPQADRLLPENRRAKARPLHKRIFRMMAEPRDLVNAQSMIMPSRKK
jgi:hypothetical protein